MLDFLGTICLITSIVVAQGSISIFLDASCRAKLLILGSSGVWIGLQAAIAASGGFRIR